MNRLNMIRWARPFSTKPFNSILYNHNVWTRQVEFNRPEVLNSLNLEMIRHLTPKLQSYETNQSIQAITFKGNGGKAFCAGGDIRYLYDNAQHDETRPLTYDFFREEYRLNYFLGSMETPVISFLNGITMGGGVGLSIHGKFVVATEKTMFSMPETGIGFFPDIGGSFFLPRLGRKLKEKENYKAETSDSKQTIHGQGLGTFLALTGERINGEEARELGIATHLVSTELIDQVEHHLSGMNLQSSWDQEKKDHVVSSFIEELTEDDNEINPEFLTTVEDIFGANNENDTVEGIMERLEQLNTDWSKKMLKKLKKMSPLSLKVTHRQMREGAIKTRKECFQMEYRIACRMMENPDFIEGVRALIVDKDNQPKWKHESIEQVTEDDVNVFFQPLAEEEELILIDA